MLIINSLNITISGLLVCSRLYSGLQLYLLLIAVSLVHCIIKVFSSISGIHSLQVLRDSLGFIVMSSDRIGRCDDGGSSRKCADNPSFSQTDALLLHGLQKSLMLAAHLIKLINTTDTW